MSCLVVTPCYGGMATVGYLRSCLDLKEAWEQVGFPHGWLLTSNESLVTRARNTSAARFLTETDYERLLFVDADIEFTPDDVAKLWNLDEDVAVAAYAMKRADNPLAAWRGGVLVEITDEMTEPFAVDFAGTGFMMIKRGVFEHLKDAHPEIAHAEGLVGDCWAFFDTGVVDDGAGPYYCSEDYWFCRSVRALGGQIVMDPTIRLGHWGSWRYG